MNTMSLGRMRSLFAAVLGLLLPVVGFAAEAGRAPAAGVEAVRAIAAPALPGPLNAPALPGVGASVRLALPAGAALPSAAAAASPAAAPFAAAPSISLPSAPGAASAPA